VSVRKGNGSDSDEEFHLPTGPNPEDMPGGANARAKRFLPTGPDVEDMPNGANARAKRFLPTGPGAPKDANQVDMDHPDFDWEKYHSTDHFEPKP
jgi:hypothetical protein